MHDIATDIKKAIYVLSENFSIKATDDYTKFICEYLSSTTTESNLKTALDIFLSEAKRFKLPSIAEWKDALNGINPQKIEENNYLINFELSQEQEKSLENYPKTKVFIKRSKELFNISARTIESMIQAKNIIEDCFKNEIPQNIIYALNECYKYKKNRPTPAQVIAVLQDEDKEEDVGADWKRYLKNIDFYDTDESKKIKGRIRKGFGAREAEYTLWIKKPCILSLLSNEETLKIESFSLFILDYIEQHYSFIIKKALNVKEIVYAKLEGYEFNNEKAS
jgi:hypothetical protein